ncbi:hypothetical protein CEXT_702661 [Caerostris extrusa]|uniref:Uncharacterized protein n=1 Tax=Caerostris extrusa TaxID=172846 RepID=A0AAV4Y8A9_CAEEX|nr:hypothetical protein CEXT_702661 [Caerostris extrusa]
MDEKKYLHKLCARVKEKGGHSLPSTHPAQILSLDQQQGSSLPRHKTNKISASGLAGAKIALHEKER